MFEAILTISLLGLTALTVYVAFASIKKSYLEAKAEKQAIVDAVRARTQEANDKFHMKLISDTQASKSKVRSNLKTRQTSSAPTYRSRQDDTSVDDSLLVTAAVVTAFATPSYESSSSSYSGSYSSYDSSSSSSDSSSSSSSD